MRIREIGERELIRRLARRCPKDATVLEGIGDDAAVIRQTPGRSLLVTCDMLIEGVHFDIRSATPFQIGWKALAVNISDIAAMGGVPRWAVISLGLDRDCTVRFVDGIYRGIGAIARQFGVNIIGGDTNASRYLVIDVALIGEVEQARQVTRRGARVGDIILVTGEIGAGGVRHLNFTPRLAESRKLVKEYAVHSMIDVSDGLLLDLGRILDSSGVGALIYENLIPVSRHARSFRAGVTAGEDFELLFTMSSEETARFFRRYAASGIKVPVSVIGHIDKRRYGFRMKDRRGRIVALEPKGYEHF